jgi:anaerobic magnesium-protoporphyrin IX monomethyl ester cyclase
MIQKGRWPDTDTLLRATRVRKRRSVALIQTPCYELDDDRLEPPLGLLYMATLLRLHSHQACIVDLSSIPRSEWINTIPSADIYGFSTFTTTYSQTLQVLEVVRKLNSMAWTVAGGPHASALPQDVAREFDFVVVGEGEQAILRLVQALEAGETPPRIMSGQPVADLNSLPFPDYSLVDIDSYRRLVAGRPSLSILSSRGCPYRCVFCNSIVMGRGQRIRFRSAVNVVQEIRSIKALWGVLSFRFQDDIFTLNLPRLREMTALLRDEEIAYRCFGRVDRCSEEVTNLLYEGGCRHISFGVESGSPIILERMQKGQTTYQIRQGIAAAKLAGLIVRAYLIVGFPGETWETVQESVDLMLECAPDEFSVYPLIPYPGTPLYEQPEMFGITAINPDFSQYFQVRRGRGTGYTFQTADLDEKIIADMRAYIIDSLEPSITWAGDSRGYR